MDSEKLRADEKNDSIFTITNAMQICTQGREGVQKSKPEMKRGY